MEEKKEDDDDEEEMEGKRRDEEGICMMEEGMIVETPFGPFCLFCSSCFKVISSKKKKLNNRIADIHKEPT